MANLRLFHADELLIRPGTYFNPQTEVMIVVDDSPDVEQEIFEGEEIESDQWVLIADAAPIDEGARDELIEEFQVTAQQRSAKSREELDEDTEEIDELDPDVLIEEEE